VPVAEPLVEPPPIDSVEPAVLPAPVPEAVVPLVALVPVPEPMPPPEVVPEPVPVLVLLHAVPITIALTKKKYGIVFITFIVVLFKN
jgi:hypothetical protein